MLGGGKECRVLKKKNRNKRNWINLKKSQGRRKKQTLLKAKLEKKN